MKTTTIKMRDEWFVKIPRSDGSFGYDMIAGPRNVIDEPEWMKNFPRFPELIKTFSKLHINRNAHDGVIRVHYAGFPIFHDICPGFYIYEDMLGNEIKEPCWNVYGWTTENEAEWEYKHFSNPILAMQKAVKELVGIITGIVEGCEC